MSSALESVDLDNPYFHLRNAEQAELAGELDTAELAYKAAIMAADNLPLNEHRKNYERELARAKPQGRFNANQTNAGGASIAELNDAYGRLLGLPVHTRLRLGYLFYVQGNLKDARIMCDEAQEIGVDPLIVETAESKRLLIEAHKLHAALSRVDEQDPIASQFISMSHVLRIRSIKRTGAPPAECVAMADMYRQLNVGVMWSHRRNARAVRDEHATGPIDTTGLEALTEDPASVLLEMYGAARSFLAELANSGRCTTQSFTWTNPIELDEHVQVVDAFGTTSTHLVRVWRCRISDRFWSLSMRGDAIAGLVEVFLIPTHDLLNPGLAENDASLRARFCWLPLGSASTWTHQGFPVYVDEIRSAVRSVLKEIIQRAEEFSSGQPGLSDSVINFTTGGNMMKKVFELSQQKASLAEKLVYQHESLQNRIARDIHDAVIADILAVKRSFAEGGTPLSHDDIVSSLEHVAQRLRGICQDLSTRDLQDWGLKTAVRDVLQRVADRCQARWKLNCPAELPNLPYEVQLHLYRIVQECLTNIEKYAKAQHVQLDLGMEESIFYVSVEDDGVGFDPSQKTTRKASEGGMGLNTIRERVALIQCFYPAQVWIQSQVGKGTKTTVQINLSTKTGGA